MVDEFEEEEQWIVSLAACLEVYENRFAPVCDQYIAGMKISVSKSKGVKLTDNTLETKKELFIEEWTEVTAVQGFPLDLLHGKAITR